jgi:hypothetical protein
VSDIIDYINRSLTPAKITISKQELIQFITDINTRSEKKRLEAVRKFFLSNYELFSREEIDSFVLPLEELANKMTEIGRNYSQKKTMKFPLFKSDFGSGKEGSFVYCCGDRCGRKIELPANVFFQKKGKNWLFWCPMPECWPQQWRERMENNKMFNKWKNGDPIVSSDIDDSDDDT